MVGVRGEERRRFRMKTLITATIQASGIKKPIMKSWLFLYFSLA